MRGGSGRKGEEGAPAQGERVEDGCDGEVLHDAVAARVGIAEVQGPEAGALLDEEGHAMVGDLGEGQGEGRRWGSVVDLCTRRVQVGKAGCVLRECGEGEIPDACAAHIESLEGSVLGHQARHSLRVGEEGFR
jgi:hypothetical protein